MSKRVTSFDVAKQAGVSRSVVSAVLNGTQGIGVSAEKRAAVLDAIRDLNYQVDAQARGMKTGKSQCLAAYGNVSNALFLQVLEGMQEVCAGNGYHLLLYASGPVTDQKGLLDLYLQRRIDGIVALDRPNKISEEWVELINQHNLPYVSVEGYPDHNRIASVLMDYGDSIRKALDYLWKQTGLPPAYLEMFHQHAPLGWGDHERKQTYLEWCAAKGLQPQMYSAADGPWEERADYWKKWIQERRTPFALLSNWSRGAVYVCRAAQLQGIQIGKDIHVMAADNTERINQHLFPAITSIEIPYREMGRLAALRLLEYIDGQRSYEDKSTISVSAQLVARHSVGS
ncbi:LacI family DNA-binding transcriptional regulator [Paenibacillus sp. LMG 31456]|uniref:LacI family DNA-binding transcriptional regulator n=1 Tax=Paenibacillus foliorum TaxID=2654974 RepID=A0A972GR35_9BACL|nr:LacI family DNA-binding transcriptional regulator [Paenibacillus foliorum]NOU92267.1 LacI family DNA-binding transcriptional regulator [Paenibacillus foliorum]